MQQFIQIFPIFLFLYRLYHQTLCWLVLNTGDHGHLINIIHLKEIIPVRFVNGFDLTYHIGTGTEPCFIYNGIAFFDIFQISEILFIVPIMGTEPNVPVP